MHRDLTASADVLAARLRTSEGEVASLTTDRANLLARSERSKPVAPAVDSAALRTQLASLEKDLKRTRAELLLKSGELARKSEQVRKSANRAHADLRSSVSTPSS